MLKKLNPSSPTADNGFISLRVNGSNPPFTVEVDGPESFTETVNNSGDIVDIIGLTTGASLIPPFNYKPYTITVTDVSGCTTTYFTDENNIPNVDKLTLSQPPEIPYVEFQDYVDYAYSQYSHYDKIVSDTFYQIYGGRWGFYPKNQYPVYRNSITIGGRYWNSGNSYHMRLFNGNVTSNLKVWIGDGTNKRIAYTGGWFKITNSNSVDLGWGRKLYIYVSEYINTKWTWKLHNIPVEISDNNQQDSFNVAKCFIHFDFDTNSFDGDSSKSYGNYDSSTGVNVYVNKTNNGKLIDETGNTIIESINNPFTDIIKP